MDRPQTGFRQVPGLHGRNRTAAAPKLADAAIDGMWFFLGVQVDPYGLRPQPVRLLELAVDDEPLHVLLAEEGRRLLIASKQGREGILDGLVRMQIEVEWTEEEWEVCGEGMEVSGQPVDRTDSPTNLGRFTGRERSKIQSRTES